MSRPNDDNHADQLNPNNDAYWESRGEDVLVAGVAKSLAVFRDQKGLLKGHVVLKPFAARANNGRLTSGKAA